MLKNQTSPTFRITIFLSSVLITFALILAGSALMPGFSSQPVTAVQAAEAETITGTVYIPAVMLGYPLKNPFGIESSALLKEGSLMLSRAQELNTGWVRLGSHVDWSQLQSVEGGPIDWGLLANLEDELRGLKASGITPVVTIRRSPLWAVYTNVRKDGQPTTCAAIRTDKFEDFAVFVEQVVQRYSTPEFNVHHWEIGNEPDVDPDYVIVDSGFGCWGDTEDPFYGGEHFGEMLKYIAPRIRKVDQGAVIWLGGLLLATPNTTDPALGKPELFLKGILEAGAGDSFDGVPYHWYPSYWDFFADYDNDASSPWDARGGGVLGKAQYIRQLLTDYGYTDKLISLNETAFGCIEGKTWCEPDPDPAFFENQADMLVRMYTRGLSVDLDSITWYTLNGPGWRDTGLLESDASYRPAFIAYRTLAQQLYGSVYQFAVDYGPDIEAYQFKLFDHRVHVLWNTTNTSPATIEVPASKYIATYLRDGSEYTATQVGDYYQIEVGFSPIYVNLAP